MWILPLVLTLLASVISTIERNSWFVLADVFHNVQPVSSAHAASLCWGAKNCGAGSSSCSFVFHFVWEQSHFVAKDIPCRFCSFGRFISLAYQTSEHVLANLMMMMRMMMGIICYCYDDDYDYDDEQPFMHPASTPTEAGLGVAAEHQDVPLPAALAEACHSGPFTKHILGCVSLMWCRIILVKRAR